MSRLESNAEPSMEEILASIRKIIAEDSSGLRSPAASPKPGTPYSPSPRSAPTTSPAATPQRGFMSREAFLKSSQVAEPEARPSYTPQIAPRSPSVESAGAASPIRTLGDMPATETPSRREPSLREKEAPQDVFRVRDDLRTKDDILPRGAPSPGRAADAQSFTLEPVLEDQVLSSATIETVSLEVLPIEDVVPVLGDEIHSRVAAEPEPAAIKPKTETDTARIEAQLTELLSEDLNALRQARSRALADAQPAGTDESKVQTAESQPSEQSRSDEADINKSPAESSDPFSFDLGPSPFAAKAEPTRTAAVGPGPAAVSPSPASAFGPFFTPAASDPIDRAASADTPAEQGEPTKPASASADRPVDAENVSSTTRAEPEAPVARPRPKFAIPSVSATLGPSRKLEPLSNAFRPAPPPPPPALESIIPDVEAAPEPPRPEPAFAPEPPRAAEPAALPPPPPMTGSHKQDEEAVARTTLPATASDIDRSMEDAVADLLRPLLKTWLAENMPKIVERALRREMSERLLPSQKNPPE